jgi:hypothetical protein
VHRNTLAARYNPLGLSYEGRFAYRYRLYDSKKLALNDNFLGIGLCPWLSPVYARFGPYVEFNPLTVLGFWAMVQWVQYFGLLNQVQGFESPAANFSDQALSAGGARKLAASGWEVTIGATLQLKVGPIVIRDQARAVRASLGLRDGDRIYYDQIYDVGVPNEGWFVINEADVLWQGLGDRLTAGLRYSLANPIYEAKHFAPGEPQEADNSTHRLGPLVSYAFRKKDGARIANGSVFLLAQWWLKHRFRTGADTPQGLPLIAVGVQISGDLLRR